MATCSGIGLILLPSMVSLEIIAPWRSLSVLKFRMVFGFIPLASVLSLSESLCWPLILYLYFCYQFRLILPLRLFLSLSLCSFICLIILVRLSVLVHVFDFVFVIVFVLVRIHILQLHLRMFRRRIRSSILTTIDLINIIILKLYIFINLSI